MATTPTPSAGASPPVASATPRRRRARVLGVAAVAVLGVVFVLPDLVGLDSRTPIVQIVAFRPLAC